MSTFSPKTRSAVSARSGGLCERCREAEAQHHHHRMAKGMGGNRSSFVQSPANDAHVCLPCHAEIHAHPTDAYESGWLIRRAGGDVDPEQIPLEDLKGGRFFLTDDGKKLDRHHFYGTPNPPPF